MHFDGMDPHLKVVTGRLLERAKFSLDLLVLLGGLSETCDVK